MKLNLKLMYIISFLQGLVFYAPVSLIYRKQRGLSVSEFFFLEFILLLIVVLTEIPWGYFADKYGYKKTLMISYLLFFLGRLSLLFCSSFMGFLGQTVLTALGISGTSGCDIAFLYKSCDLNESEKVFGRYSAFNSLAFFISSISSSFFISISIELAVLATVIAYGVSVVIMYFIEDIEIESSSHNKNLIIKEIFKDINDIKWIFVFVIATAIIAEISYGISINLGQLHFESIGIDIRLLGDISAFSELLAMLSCKTHTLSKKFGQDKTLKTMINIMLLCVLVLILTNSIIISIIAICSLSGLISMISPIVLDIKNKSISKNRATVLSVYSMIGSIVSTFINIAVGFCADIYLKYAFVAYFVIMGVGVFGVYLYMKNIN
ncbi:MFS transporter [Romboutsia lituseburensis]|uniref:MFS transporter n=1 Tax=Romboutsia lituseburensis TaxID=1537 RepID=UPI00215AE341|nr:MFS transporter [Romboutsia lituseburensis]MCR8744661.1 MFS transporter [Romboutsia lituseburensis]